MKLKVFTSSGKPDFAAYKARNFIETIYAEGYEVVKMQISETNGFWDGNGTYTLKLWYEMKEKPIIRKFEYVCKYKSQEDALEYLEKLAKNNYISIDVFECSSFWKGKEVSGVVLF